MSYWILTIAGRVISCVNVQRLTPSESETDEFKQQMKKYDERISEIDTVQAAQNETNYGEMPEWNRLALNDDDPEFQQYVNQIIDDENIPHADQSMESDHTPDSFDPYLNMELALNRGDNEDMLHARVKRRALDEDGELIGIASNNPMTDTRQYEVEYIDGSVETLTANTIAENLLAQVDEEGHRQLLLSEIIDHRTTDESVKD